MFTEAILMAGETQNVLPELPYWLVRWVSFQWFNSELTFVLKV